MKTEQEIEDLKHEWVKDPCWDIEDEEGFGEHRDELVQFRRDKEREWELQRPWLVWCDYGQEGWMPRGFVRLCLAVKFVLDEPSDSRKIITRQHELSAAPTESEQP